MEIIIGSKNPTKVQAVAEIFESDQVNAIEAKSKVSAQPFSDEETKQGAINRAMECRKYTTNGIGIGLEGGVMFVGDTLYLCNWGALVAEDWRIFTASGARIALPNELVESLKNGFELGEIMDDYANRKEVSTHEGTIGIFTNDLVSRKEMFAHVVKLLRGQWEYWK
ncbi:DUF84 family protein [Oceanobacillus sp. 143]|uniref:inosine/xanthosine triphosphatase n=1 Tax=Oceanobacillus zhaokaii TaxID=2052660 RepID=A0A345PIB3_9BACI|nr:DUF84 family protein [Oceanobacillus zhaokaii]AXI09743.1 inosine/xanthosine triphosphatase [Oceanobacillus zhaokaii]QGS69047.1 DUF84 family protein [Oceanobacillus sp. 143]